MKIAWRGLSILVSISLLLSFTGCVQNSDPPETSDQPTAQSQAPETGEPAETTESIQPESTSEEPAPFPEQAETPPIAVEPTGAVLSKEEAAALGNDVLYGMYDFETNIELPLTAEEAELSYWLMLQPFTSSYSIDINECTFYKEMEARTGVHLELMPSSVFVAAEQFMLVISSGDFPDMMEGVGSYYSGGTAKAVEEGVFVDFTEFMEEYMPNYTAWLDTYPNLRAEVTNLDGTIATAGSIGSGIPWNIGTQIRLDWVEELGLELPVTYDDYHDVLTAFKTEYGAGLWLDPDGTTRNNSYSAGYNVILESEGSPRPFRVMDGVVEYSPYTEDYREYLALINSWWEEGLIYKDFLSQAAISTPDAGVVANNEIGIWVSDADTMLIYEEASENIDIGAIAQPRKTPDQILHIYLAQATIGDGVVISTDCKDIELAARWLDYSYTYDGMLLNCYGVEGEGMEFDHEGNPQFSDLVLNDPNMIMIACVVVYARFTSSGVFNLNCLLQGNNQEQKDAIELWTTGVDTEYEFPAAAGMTTEQSERYSLLMSELQSYVDQSTLGFIVGEKSTETGWDDYLRTLESLKVDELNELMQTIYDKYIELMG